MFFLIIWFLSHTWGNKRWGPSSYFTSKKKLCFPLIKWRGSHLVLQSNEFCFKELQCPLVPILNLKHSLPKTRAADTESSSICPEVIPLAHRFPCFVFQFILPHLCFGNLFKFSSLACKSFKRQCIFNVSLL